MSAYYSRARSYSRSHNAEMAELDNRYPLTRFCQFFGLDKEKVKAKGTTEWHHVGKYATMVDYYDWREFVTHWQEYSRSRPNVEQLRNRRWADQEFVSEADRSELAALIAAYKDDNDFLPVVRERVRLSLFKRLNAAGTERRSQEGRAERVKCLTALMRREFDVQELPLESLQSVLLKTDNLTLENARRACVEEVERIQQLRSAKAKAKEELRRSMGLTLQRLVKQNVPDVDERKLARLVEARLTQRDWSSTPLGVMATGILENFQARVSA